MVKNEKSNILSKKTSTKYTNTMNELENNLVTSTDNEDLTGSRNILEENNPPHTSSRSGFLSTIGNLKRLSWRKFSRRFSRNDLGSTFTESSASDDNIDDSEDQSNYNAIDDQNVPQEQQNNQDNGGDGRQTPFIQFFFKSRGPPQIVMLSMLFALSLGSTVGVVPAILTERYAVLYHNFDGECSDYGMDDKPQACIDGSSDAQTAAAASSFVSNVATFLTSSLIGSISDEYGRRNVMILGQFLTCLAPTILVLLQIFSNMHPGWYYTADAAGGIVSWISIALSSLSDVMPREWRAPMFGLLLSGFSLGFALSPIFAIFCSRLGVTLLSFTILFLSFLYSVFFLPETLSMEQAAEARLQRSEYRMQENESKFVCISRSFLRPFKELLILNRNNLFRLLSLLAFFSGMSTSADQTLLIYYVEDRLGFNNQDIAILFGLIGIIGIFVQGVLLKIITDWVGERFVIVIAFTCGAITNTLYAFAKTKGFIFFAVVVSSFTGMSFPTISAIKANNAEESEQGRIQGALYALSSLASAVGPATLRVAYQETKDTKQPGSFFLVATGFYIVAVACAFALPKDKANARRRGNEYNEVSLVEAANETGFD